MAGSGFQNRKGQCSRMECDAFNDFHFRRLLKSRGQEVAPKVGEEPLTLEAAKLLDEDSSLRPRAQTAPNRQLTSGPEDGDVKTDISSPRREIRPTCQQRSGALSLKETWRQQLEERAKLMEVFRVSEEKWPYCPERQPHMRVPATAPKYIEAHYVRPYDATHLPLSTRCFADVYHDWPAI